MQARIVDQRTLEYSEAEIAAVRAASALLDTPRALKRLINVYRVLRATADPASQDRLEAECAYVILLLAVTYGRPIAAPNLFALVNNPASTNTPLPQLLTQHLHTAAVPTATPTTPDAAEDAIPSAPPIHIAELYQEVLDLLVVMGPAAPTDPTTLRYWLPIVARYSFRHHRLTATSPPDTRRSANSSLSPRSTRSSLPDGTESTGTIS